MQADKIEAQNKLATWQDLNTRVLALKTKATRSPCPAHSRNARPPPAT